MARPRKAAVAPEKPAEGHIVKPGGKRVPQLASASTGRWVTQYDWPSVIEAACQAVEERTGIQAWCEAEPGRPTFAMLYRKIASNPEWVARYEAAKAVKAESFDDEYDDLVRDVKSGAMDFKAARVIADIRARLRGQLNAKYNDRLAHLTVNVGTGDDIADRMEKAFQRALEGRKVEKAEVVDAGYTEVE